MSKQRVLSILAKSADRQRNLDTLLQTVISLNVNGEHFQQHVITYLKSDIVSLINDMRSIENILFDILGQDYTNTTYTYVDSAGFLPPINAFTSVDAAAAYYKTYIAGIIAEIEAESAETQFVGDSEGQGVDNNNTIYDKDAALAPDGVSYWSDIEAAMLTTLADVMVVLNNEVPSVS